MKFRLLFFALAFLCTGEFLNAQVTFFSENIGSGTTTQSIAATVFQNSPAITFTGSNADTRVSLPSHVIVSGENYAGSSGGKNVFFNNGLGGVLNISGINTSDYTGITLSFGHYKSTTAANNELTIEYSTDGVTYFPVSYSRPTGTGTQTWIMVTATTTIPSTPNLRLRFTQTSGTAQFRIDDISLTGMHAGPFTVKSGNWNDPTVWSTNSVPLSTDHCTITSPHVVYTTATLQRDGSTVVNGTFELRNGGFAQGTNFTYGSNGGLNFNTTAVYGINNNHVYWPATSGPVNVSVLSGGIQLNSMSRTVSGTFATGGNLGVAFAAPSSLTLNGICRIDTNGYFLNAPIFGNASELIYNTGGTYGRGFEWSFNGVGTIGTSAGYPNNVTLANNTVLDYNNGTPGAKAMNGTLTVGAGSHFSMNIGTSSNQPLTVGGNFANNGTVTLGNVSGADLKLVGDFANSGTFNGNARAVFFSKASGTQTVSSTTALTIPYVVFDNTGSRTVQLNSNLTISAPSGGNAIAFNSAADVFSLNNQSLTIGTNGVANAISGNGTFNGTTSTTTTSEMTLLGTGSIGTLNFTSGSQNLGSLTINRTSNGLAATLGTALRVQSTLSLTAGLLDVGNNVLTLGPTIAYTGNNLNYIIADKANANAELRKMFAAAGTFTFPIGDRTASANASQYSPCTVVLVGGNYSSTSYVGVGVNDIAHPDFDSAADFLTRYWSIRTFGITNPTTFTAAGTYLPADVNTPANEATYRGQRWDGSNWTPGALVSGSSTGALNCVAASTNEITAGIRSVDINVRGVIAPNNPSISSGDTTPSGLDNTLFAAQAIGTSATKTFRIENTGDGTLNVSSITLTGANPGDFSITASTPYNIVGPTNFVDFTITFLPTASGVRTAIVNIASNDPTPSESPYTFMVQGTGNCPAGANTVTPASGPAGTLVTITANSGNLNGASVTFNGVPAVVTQISATQVTVVVPDAAVSGPIITTNASGCSVSTAFSVINQVATGCQGGAALPGNLFISQLTDSGVGAMSYIEIYNGTGATVNLNGWSLQFFNNGSATQNGGIVNLNNFNLANGASYTVAVGLDASCASTPGANGSLATQQSGISGINFHASGNTSMGHDHIRLYNGGTHVDSWGVYQNQSWATSLNLGESGANFVRKNDVVVPNTAYTNSDWIISDWADDCASLDFGDIGTFDFIAGTPPTVTVQPTFSPSCKETSFTVVAIEGFAGGNGLAYQWFQVAPGAANWTALTDGGIYSGATAPTLTISNIGGLGGYQYYVQVRENTATCFTASNAVMISGAGVSTWNGTAWTPSAPTDITPAVIDGNYNTAANGSFEACSLTVNPTRTLTISPNTYVSIVNDLTVSANATLRIEDDGSLVMVEDSGVVTNNGLTQVVRTTPPYNKFDYTYWSSPVAATTIGAALAGWRLDYSWTYNTANYSDVTGTDGTGPADGFDDNNDVWSFAGAGATMTPAVGYAVMGPTNLGAYPAQSTVAFTGAVNNGVVTVPLALSANNAESEDDFNLVGNPYPSAIFADDLILQNPDFSGTLWFWTHSTPISSSAPGPDQYNFTRNDYAMYNLSGGVASTSGSLIPTGYVASGQAFMVEAITSSTLTFNNSMRDKGYGNANFYRASSITTAVPAGQKDRVWLNVEHEIGLFSQQLICYSENATLGVDRGYDGPVGGSGNAVNFYSFIDGNTYKIQGRPSFDASDIVPLGLKTAWAGTYTISIGQAEGILNDPLQPVYIEDKLLNIIHDLKQGPYSFTVPVGVANDRFQLRYTDSALGNPDPQFGNSVAVVSAKDEIRIQSKTETISEVAIFDLLGRQLYSGNGLNANEISVPVAVQEQALLVKTTLSNGAQINKKIVH